MTEQALADPSQIDPYDRDGIMQVVIETPKGSRNKFAFDEQQRVMVLKKVLPSGMSFPYDFGFVPSTLAEDGDPLDVLLLMDEPAFPGCVVGARLIGVIEGEDELEGGGRQRNDRLLAVATVSEVYDDVHTVDDLPTSLLRSLKEFFVNYPKVLSGKTFKLIGLCGPREAKQLIDAARQNAKDKAE